MSTQIINPFPPISEFIELKFIMDSFTTIFKPVDVPAARFKSLELLDVTKYGFNGATAKKFDLIKGVDRDGCIAIFLGHWNSGKINNNSEIEKTIQEIHRIANS